MSETRVLFTKKVIALYLGVSKDKIVRFRKKGAPISINDTGTYWAHKDDLEEWFRKRLKKELEIEKKRGI